MAKIERSIGPNIPKGSPHQSIAIEFSLSYQWLFYIAAELTNVATQKVGRFHDIDFGLIKSPTHNKTHLMHQRPGPYWPGGGPRPIIPPPRPPPPPTVCASAYVVAQGGDVKWSSREKEIGDGFDVDEVVAVVQGLS